MDESILKHFYNDFRFIKQYHFFPISIATISPRFREVTSHEMCHQLVHWIIEGFQFFHI